MRITNYILKLALPLVLFLGGAIPAFPQGVRYDNILLGAGGSPRGGVTVAVCQPTGLATTAASVSGNVATLTMSSNPSTLGFVVGGNISVTGFTGADAYFNGSFVLTAVSSTTLTFNLTHANASATSNGAVTQTVSAGATCAPFAVISNDQALTQALTQPIRTDGLGNYGFWGAPGSYSITFNGAGVTPTTNALVLPCVPNSNCPGLGGVGTVTSFSAGNLSPLFTSSVATPTTTPALSFTLNSQSANLLFASPNGSSGAPSFRAPVGADFGSQTANTFLAAPNGSAGNPLFRTIAGADVPATTSNCSGVQFAQGLNAGHTPVCATPPTFVASGASHTVGYVPDPGSSAGTTRFLREDATWVTPSSTGYKIECINTSPVTVTNTASETVLMTCSIPANELGNNQTLRIHASGTNVTAATQSLTMRVRIGGLGGTQLGASDVAIANSSGGAWNLDFSITANAAPSGATATECQGRFFENNGTTNPLGTTMSNSATVSWATNSTLSLVITQAWSAAVTATFTEREMIVERLN